MGRQPRRGDAWSGFETAWTITATLLAGLLVWGGIGYLADRLVGFRWLFLPIGMVVGMAGGIYVVYMKYGRDHDQT
jgi:ATP synthase protein I